MTPSRIHVPLAIAMPLVGLPLAMVLEVARWQASSVCLAVCWIHLCVCVIGCPVFLALPIVSALLAGIMLLGARRIAPFELALFVSPGPTTPAVVSLLLVSGWCVAFAAISPGLPRSCLRRLAGLVKKAWCAAHRFRDIAHHVVPMFGQMAGLTTERKREPIHLQPQICDLHLRSSSCDLHLRSSFVRLAFRVAASRSHRWAAMVVCRGGRGKAAASSATPTKRKTKADA